MFDLDGKEPFTKALDAIFEVMNVLRSHLVLNTSLREAFDEDLKSLKPEMQPIANRLLRYPQEEAGPGQLQQPALFITSWVPSFPCAADWHPLWQARQSTTEHKG